MDYVAIRRLEHLSGASSAPSIRFAIETRDRPGPIFKNGAFENELMWIQLLGGLFVAKARVQISWVGEYSNLKDIRARTRGSALHDNDEFWSGRPRYGYAAVVALRHESWIEPFWGGPRTYGYEIVRLEDDSKRKSWLDKREAPRQKEDLQAAFKSWLSSRA